LQKRFLEEVSVRVSTKLQIMSCTKYCKRWFTYWKSVYSVKWSLLFELELNLDNKFYRGIVMQLFEHGLWAKATPYPSQYSCYSYWWNRIHVANTSAKSKKPNSAPRVNLRKEDTRETDRVNRRGCAKKGNYCVISKILIFPDLLT